MDCGDFEEEGVIGEVGSEGRGEGGRGAVEGMRES